MTRQFLKFLSQSIKPIKVNPIGSFLTTNQNSKTSKLSLNKYSISNIS